MLDIMQERAEKLVSHPLGCLNITSLHACSKRTCTIVGLQHACLLGHSMCPCKSLPHARSRYVSVQAVIYQDEDDSRKDDIASLKVDQGDFKVFYDRVRDLKDYYRNRPIEVTEVSPLLLSCCTVTGVVCLKTVLITTLHLA